MSGRTKCETCCGWYASGYTRCPECATAPTPDAVAKARKKYTATLPELDYAYRHLGPSEIAAAEENTECAWAEVLAAVRAECAAKVRARAELMSPYDRVWVEQTIAALEAQP